MLNSDRSDLMGLSDFDRHAWKSRNTGKLNHWTMGLSVDRIQIERNRRHVKKYPNDKKALEYLVSIEV